MTGWNVSPGSLGTMVVWLMAAGLLLAPAAQALPPALNTQAATVTPTATGNGTLADRLVKVDVQAKGDGSAVIRTGTQYVQTLQNSGIISREYLLGPNDVISLTFPFAPEMKQEKIRVLPDGTVNLALVGTLNVSGISLGQLRDTLMTAYGDYLVQPALTLNLEQSKPFIINVSGAVLNPGVYELNTMTEQAPLMGAERPEIALNRRTPLLSNILTAAGGIRYDADLEHVAIKNQLTQSETTVDLMALLEGDINNDIYLIPGDTVHVPAMDTMRMIPPERYHKFASATFSQRAVPVKVYGYVNKPGLVTLDPRQTLNLNSAITSAGGYMLDSAYAPRQVIISRRDTTGMLASIAVDPTKEDVNLMPNDIVYVPQKVVPRIGLFFDFLTRVVTPAGVVAGAGNGWAFLFNPQRTSVQIGR